MLAMITTCPSSEPLLFSLVSISMVPLTLSRDAACATTSFGWSDFPCQGDDLMEEQQLQLCDFVPPPPSIRKFSCCREDVKMGLPPSPRSSIQHDLDAACQSLPVVRKASHDRRVSFSPVMQVRTHNVILGDHPCCSGGMALQCGWESAETELINLDLHERYTIKRSMAQLRLSYAKRRERLQEVTGLSGSQLLQEEYKLVCCTAQDGEPSFVLRHAPTLRQIASSSDV